MVVTEKRVTKGVIRRRATSVASPKPIIGQEAKTKEEVSTSTKPATLTAPEKTEEPGKGNIITEIETSKESASQKEIQASSKAPEKLPEQLPEPPDDGSYDNSYKRLKVVTPTESAPNEKASSESKTTQETRVGSILAAPKALGLGRKEIIEIRDFHKPKASRKRRLAPGKKAKKTEITTPKATKRVVRISDNVTVSDLAKKMSVKAGEVIKKLMSMGMMVTINHTIDMDTSTLVASEFGYEVENVFLAPEDLLLEHEKEQEVSKPEDLKPRSPVVTVMGHVDHGKTTLLDRIRKSDVAAKEAGGITQHIGAYTVKIDSGKSVTFIDTPGHEAFTAMRARGAKVTDLVILVVAADDGVMPQTKEAINHAQSAKVPILVAINKMDKPGANPDKIKKELTEFNMVPEEWGGDTIYVPVSAKSGDGMTALLDFVTLQSDILELKANPKRSAKGVVIESSIDKRRGVIATILVQDGTLKEGDFLIVGTQMGRIRAMKDDKGARVREAGPSFAVEIMGLSGVAKAGDNFSVVTNEKKAKQITELRHKINREQDLGKTAKVSLDDLYQKIEQGDVKELKVIVKADTAGSVEVLTDALQKLSTAKVSVRVVHGAVGGISENDVMLAKASGAFVIAFHVRPDAKIRTLAEQQEVEIRYYNVIYELTEDVTKAMGGLLAPKKIETILGHAEVRQIFAIPKAGTIAGCMVSDGKFIRSAQVHLIRDSVPVYTGRLKSLRRFKDDVKEVASGMECGMSIENFNDLKVGDIIEAFTVKEVAASLE